jgi:hypothetical protein
MNFFAAFQSEVFRPLVTLLIPGALAISSWLVALCREFPALKSLMTAHSAETYVILFLVVTAVGIIVEDIGAKIEIHFDDIQNEATDNRFEDEWFAYLKTSFLSDPIGRGYARTLVLRLKFQLGIMLGSSVAAAGIIWLLWLGVSWDGCLILLLLAAVIALWHYKAAKDVHEALAQVRHELGQEIRIVSAKS